MINFIEKKLFEDKLSCVISKKDKIVFTSTEKGILPLIKLSINDCAIFYEGNIADKVIGKAAASILCKNNIKYCFAEVMSKSAKDMLLENNIECKCTYLVDFIENREATDMCPMEKLVFDAKSYLEAYDLLYNFFKDKI